MFLLSPLVAAIVSSSAGAATNPPQQPNQLPQNETHDEVMVVTATREIKPKSELSESVTVFDQDLIERVAPANRTKGHL